MRALFIGLLLLIATCGTALGVYRSQSITYAGGTAGPVVFRGQHHSLPCSRCHNREMFPRMQQGAEQITMKAIDDGKLCGKCHNGNQAFASQGNCQRCHQQP
ncbi:MAG: cytochrome c3 family protein [Syntrophotaleaceae bacterium]